MEYFPAIFAFMVAAAGWYYLFYSRAARRLEGVELPASNRRRNQLRRMGGLLMILLGATLYVFFNQFQQPRPSAVLLLGLLAGILVLLIAIVGLGLIDLRLTARIKPHDPRTK